MQAELLKAKLVKSSLKINHQYLTTKLSKSGTNSRCASKGYYFKDNNSNLMSLSNALVDLKPFIPNNQTPPKNNKSTDFMKNLDLSNKNITFIDLLSKNDFFNKKTA